ncbi:hypothetical protein [Psychrosphaera haliotis]|uniref:hypothetical protein n=1 Tax=Psychrosphaera haliotis TaxID=555083 RepID=UPI002EDB6B35
MILSPLRISRVAKFKVKSPKLTSSSSVDGAPGSSLDLRRSIALILANNSLGLNGFGK